MLTGEEDPYLTKMNHIKVIKTSHKLFKTGLNSGEKMSIFPSSEAGFRFRIRAKKYREYFIKILPFKEN